MAALLSRMVRQSVYRAAQTSRSRRDGRHRRAQRPSRFVQVALEADPRVRAIAAGTGELERLPRRDADACGDVVAEQHPRAVETGLHGFRVDVEAGRRFGRTQALPLPQHEDRAVDLGQRIYGFLDRLAEFMV